MKNDRITKQMKGTNDFDDLKTVFCFLKLYIHFYPFYFMGDVMNDSFKKLLGKVRFKRF